MSQQEPNQGLKQWNSQLFQNRGQLVVVASPQWKDTKAYIPIRKPKFKLSTELKAARVLK